MSTTHISPSAVAKLQWSRIQIDTLARQISEIVKEQREISMFEWNAAGLPIVAKGRELIPVNNLLSVDVGRIIGAVRSSLDNLIVETVKLSDPTADETKLSFPISKKTEIEGSDAWMAGRIGSLAPPYRKIVIDTRPYKGGNDTLCALQELRNQDEHRSLNIIPITRHAVIHGESIRQFIPVPGPDGRPMPVLYQRQGLQKFETKVSINFGEGTSANGRDVVIAIREFVDEADRIIKMFDSI